MILHIKDQFLQLIRKDFNPKLEIEKRILMISDLEMFRKGEDKYIWAQSKGKTAEVYQIYFDNEFICSFKTDDIMPAVVLMFWKGFKDKYKKGMIRLDPLWKKKQEEELEKEIKKAKKAKRKKELKESKATTPEEKMAKDIVIKMEET